MEALWLEPGIAPVPMTLENDRDAVTEGPLIEHYRVSVQAGVLHGHYHTYEDKEEGQKHLMLALCTDQGSRTLSTCTLECPRPVFA